MPNGRRNPPDRVRGRKALIAFLAVTFVVGVVFGAAGGALFGRLSAPQRPNVGGLRTNTTDPLLTRTFDLDDPVPKTPLQYRWRPASGSPSAWSSTVALPPTPGDDTHWKIRVNFGATKPNQPWTLEVVSIDANGVYSQPATKAVTTPPAPIFIALGDSVTAGYHRLSSDASQVCNDAAFSYAGQAARMFYNSLPQEWRLPGPLTWSGDGKNGYYNLARSGYAAGPGGDAQGSVIGGGPDACKQPPPTLPPLSDARARLLEHTGSWNQIVITAGVNDTNWADGDGPIKQAVTALPGMCQHAIENSWSGYHPGVLSGITENVRAIYRGLTEPQDGEPMGNDIHWVGYYDISETGPLLRPDCAEPIEDALALLNGAIQSGLPLRDVDWVPADENMHQQNSLMQNFVGVGNWVPEQEGWPHPNSSGSMTIAKMFIQCWTPTTPC